MKKNIFITTYFMEIGGVERSLIGLLHNIDYSKYQVDLFVWQHSGFFMNYIPKEVNLLKENHKYAAFAKPLRSVLFSKDILIGLARVYALLLNRKKHIFNNASVFSYVVKSMSPFLPKITSKQYDLAISFIEPHPWLCNQINAKRKVAWIHTDYTSVGVDTEYELPIWSRYDNIIAISDSAKDSFLKVFPTLSDKVLVIENIISLEMLESQSLREIELIKGKEICLCSVGRFSYPKNFENIPNITKRILNAGYRIKWYIIGYGTDESLIREKIKEESVEENVIILGKKDNPYPYIKFCDIYVQPSRYEGKSVAVREAQILKKPVIITNYPTAASQVMHRIDGYIVPMDNAGCANGIIDFIKNKPLQESIISYLKQHDYSNYSEIDKFYKLID